MKRKDFIESLSEILKNRGNSYGDSTEFCDKLAKEWSISLGNPVKKEMIPIMMIQMKIERYIKSGHTHLDSLKDIAGYACLAAEMLEETTDTSSKSRLSLRLPFGKRPSQNT